MDSFSGISMRATGETADLVLFILFWNNLYVSFSSLTYLGPV